MLRLALVFLVIALVASIFNFVRVEYVSIEAATAAANALAGQLVEELAKL